MDCLGREEVVLGPGYLTPVWIIVYNKNNNTKIHSSYLSIVLWRANEVMDMEMLYKVLDAAYMKDTSSRSSSVYPRNGMAFSYAYYEWMNLFFPVYFHSIHLF